jgi:hypothetical protein
MRSRKDLSSANIPFRDQEKMKWEPVSALSEVRAAQRPDLASPRPQLAFYTTGCLSEEQRRQFFSLKQ